MMDRAVRVQEKKGAVLRVQNTELVWCGFRKITGGSLREALRLDPTAYLRGITNFDFSCMGLMPVACLLGLGAVKEDFLFSHTAIGAGAHT